MNKKLNLSAENELKKQIFTQLVNNKQGTLISSQQLQLELVSDSQGIQILISQLKNEGVNNDVFILDEIEQALEGTLISGFPRGKLISWFEQLQKQKMCTIIRSGDEIEGIKLYL